MTRKRKNKGKTLLVSLDTRHVARQHLIAGILRYAAEHHDWQVEIAGDTNGGLPLRDYLGQTFDAMVTDASPDDLSDGELAGLVRRKIVFANRERRTLKGRETTDIFTDDDSIGREAAKLFHRRHFKYVAYIPWTSQTRWSLKRGDAFRRNARRLRLAFSELSDGGDLGEFLGKLPTPCAILAANDLRARQVVERCFEAGLTIPDDIQILGVDNNELVCENCDPAISSIFPDFTIGGYRCGQWLDDSDSKSLLFPVRGIVERLTTSFLNDRLKHVALAREFIRKNALSDIRVADVARAAATSVRLLQLNYARVTGRTIVRDIMMTRFERAKRYLTRTRTPLNEIAALCGLRSASYMQTTFRRLFGQTMGEYRASRRRHDV